MKKLNFRKITALAGSLLMAGATLGLASAAAYPAPFVSGGTANVAVVYGTGSGVSSLDAVQAGNIQTDLSTYLSGSGGSTVSGGDSYKFEKTSTKFHLGDNFTAIRTSITDEQLTTLLSDGKYTDDDNDEFDYTQKITMGTAPLVLFEDSEYEDDVPTVGIKISSGTHVLNYSLTFSDTPEFRDLENTNLPLMGKEYYVLDNGTTIAEGSTKLTLLDSAESTILSEGESTTVEGKEVSISYISSTEVKLMVDGETTNSLEEGETQKLSDGSYIGVKDILYDAKDTGISKLEFSIGSGKLILTDNSEVELNEETITGLTAHIVNDTSTSQKLSSITLIWNADDDLFITEDSAVTMPGFEAISLSYGGMTYPAEEEIKVDVSNEVFTLTNFPLDDGAADIDLYYINETSGNFSGYGKDSDDQLLISSIQSILFNDSAHQYFIASWNDTSDSASYLMRATNFKTETLVNKTTIQYMKDGTWTDAKTDAVPTDEVTLGDLILNVGVIDKNAKTVNLSGDSSVQFDTLYTAEGLALTLGLESTVATTTFAGNNISSLPLVFTEEDRSGNLAAGGTFTVTLSAGGSTTKTASVTGVTGLSGTSLEIENTDVYRQFEYSALATETLYDKGDSDAKKLNILYHGDEVAADVYITSPDATVTPGDGGAIGDIIVTDAEISSVATKNLIVVGGSCINSAAATLVGGAYCGAAWTEATGVGAGQFLIKGYASSSLTSKMALLVAGYEAADTVNAATFLVNQKPDTSVGGIGTTSTADLMAFE